MGYAGAEGLWVLGDEVVVDAVLQRAQHNHRPGVLDLDLSHSIYVYCIRMYASPKAVFGPVLLKSGSDRLKDANSLQMKIIILCIKHFVNLHFFQSKFE